MDRLDALAAAKKAHGETLNGVIPAGHKCGPVTCSQEQWDALNDAGDAEKAARAALVPTERDAIDLMHECYQRLRELGWNDAIYCPKDGSEFDAIEIGSTGIHRCHYSGEWPDGHWWVADHDDLWPSRPILYRVSEEERARYREGAKKIAEMMREHASADTHPKDGDVKQAPLVSGAVPKADAQNTPSAHPSGEQTND